jgi:hypothetical protein
MRIGAYDGPARDWISPIPRGASSSDETTGATGGEPRPRVSRASESQPGNRVGPSQCRTCAERKYQDRSNDPSVSFQTPTSVAPEQAAAAVAAHEQEHVANNAARAERAGMTAHSSVAIHSAVCPECGREYVSGGTTTTTYTRSASAAPEQAERGLMVNATA